MSAWVWIVAVVVFLVVVFLGVFGPNRVRGRRWRGRPGPYV